MAFTAATNHRFLPPSPATGIPETINKAPRTPYVGSSGMSNGRYPLSSVQTLPVPLTTVPLMMTVPLAVTVALFRAPGEMSDAFVAESRVKVSVVVIEGPPVTEGGRKVVIVVVVKVGGAVEVEIALVDVDEEFDRDGDAEDVVLVLV